jgi:uncharacterized protein YecE (DUF72 family)
MIRIGISGWNYADWRGGFYPKGLRQVDELAFITHTFPSIELNGPFYRLQQANSYAKWYAATPADFVFAHKSYREITHFKRLKEIDLAMANMFASGMFRLREKLGPLLWQLPPSLRFDAVLLENFLARLPRDTASALAIAKRHEDFMAERCCLEIDVNRPLRHCMEVRNASFIDSNFSNYSVATTSH